MSEAEEALRHPAAVSWATLGARARTWRIVHASWSVAQLACLGYIWRSAVTRRRSRGLWGSVAFLVVEGAALAIGQGDCPVGPLQEEWGDPVPFFELLLPRRAAKAAVPVLAVVSLAGIGALVLRRPGLSLRSLHADRHGEGGRRRGRPLRLSPGYEHTPAFMPTSRSVGRDGGRIMLRSHSQGSSATAGRMVMMV